MALGNSQKRRIEPLDTKNNWEDVICPICLDFPHNSVLLQCSSYDKGCRPFMCDTDHTHSNCLNRFKAAYGLPTANSKTSTEEVPQNHDNAPTCPLCRGVVSGWVIIDEARTNLNSKKRWCEEKKCTFSGNYDELHTHAKQTHPNARPSEIDPERKLDWENFQQSSEIIDVLSTIHSEVPRGVVLGDYVIEYGNESGDEYEDFPGDEGNWWTSCILYQVFDNFRSSRNRRSRARDSRRERVYVDEGSSSSLDFGEYQFDDTDDEFISYTDPRGTPTYRSYRRRSSRFHDP